MSNLALPCRGTFRVVSLWRVPHACISHRELPSFLFAETSLYLRSQVATLNKHYANGRFLHMATAFHVVIWIRCCVASIGCQHKLLKLLVTVIDGGSNYRIHQPHLRTA